MNITKRKAQVHLFPQSENPKTCGHSMKGIMSSSVVILLAILSMSEFCIASAPKYEIDRTPGLQDKKQKTSPIRLLLVGKTGVGKSATGNTILQENVFDVGFETTAVTKTYKRYDSVVLGREVTVVDSPGLCDLQKSKEDSIQTFVDEIVEAMNINPDGYDAIVVVVSLGRLTADDKITIDQLKGIFGSNFIREYGILLVTRGDDFDRRQTKDQTFEQWCEDQVGVFHNLRQECQKRVVLFNNAHDNVKVKSDQTKKLFNIVDSIKDSGRYTPALFRSAKAQHYRLILQAREPKYRESAEERKKIILDQFINIKIHENLSQDQLQNHIKSLERLQEDALKEIGVLEEKDGESGILKLAIGTLEYAERLVSDKLNEAHLAIERAKAKALERRLAAEEQQRRHDEWVRQRKEDEERKQSQVSAVFYTVLGAAATVAGAYLGIPIPFL